MRVHVVAVCVTVLYRFSCFHMCLYLQVAMQFITLYSYEDIVTAMIEGSSGSVWRISPPSRQEVIKELLGSPVDLTLRLAWTFQR